MCPGLTEDLQAIHDARKTGRELHRLTINIAALQEIGLPGNGSLKEEHYTLKFLLAWYKHRGDQRTRIWLCREEHTTSPARVFHKRNGENPHAASLNRKEGPVNMCLCPHVALLGRSKRPVLRIRGCRFQQHTIVRKRLLAG